MAILFAFFSNGSKPAGSHGMRQQENKMPICTNTAGKNRGRQRRCVCACEGHSKSSSKVIGDVSTSRRCGCQMKFWLEETAEKIMVTGKSTFEHNHELAQTRAERAVYRSTETRFPSQTWRLRV
mmetsp:Transcript_4707/g.13840  ORF Transcript_4707/g.13840 Transcript_4707/m.13840 type:complete len:124 (-) Transcript_4707:495-866(-)